MNAEGPCALGNQPEKEKEREGNKKEPHGETEL